MSKSAEDGTIELYISDKIKEDIGNAGCNVENANVDSGKCQIIQKLVSNTAKNVPNIANSILEAGTGTNLSIVNGGPVDEAVNDCISNAPNNSAFNSITKYDIFARPDDKKMEFGNNKFSTNTTDESPLNSITKCAALARSDDENVAFEKNEFQSNTADGTQFNFTTKYTLLAEHDDEFVRDKILIDENTVHNGNCVELQNTVLSITVNECCVVEVPENVLDLNTVEEMEIHKIPDSNIKEKKVDENSKAKDSNSGCDQSAENVSPGLTNEHTNSVGEEDTCCLCYKVIDIFAIGECDHQICYECASRLRVICGDRSCPVCRTYLHKVIYSAQKLPYRKLDGESWRNQKYIKKWSIACRDADIHIKFLRLLKHQCPKCDIKPYANFYDLETHLNKIHQLYFCHICTQNLNQFSFERICYTDSELKLHLNKGDVGNTSFRGHPKCHFCGNRFMDKDELYKHMRHTHYYCHLCDDTMEFFHFYYQLANHFKKHHFLCEYGSCKQLEFINAFRTEIEYKAHLAREHTEEFNKYKSRNAHKISVKKLFEPSSNDRSHTLHTFTNNRIISPSTTANTQQKTQQRINLASNTEFPPLNEEAAPSVSVNVNTKRVSRKIHVEAFPPLESNYRKSNIVTASFIREEPSCSSASAARVISTNGAVNRGTSAKPNAASVIHQRNLTTQMTALNTVTVAGSLSSNERKENNTTKKNEGAALRLNEENFPSLSAQKKSSKKNKNQK
ncbi:E3 ubiquitin-protein ligase hel2-like isoform X2 [Teleopsis dalmanni]|uniref:E3 ubiquitin-protein ligase hel2-like isoform X2 n=1 Tax=Teleopsis dalmanni TaxID=139649 RepID=UPI0018CD80BD|nr:E3 ubiquitin-protein ligase hel2-like isoform X2 [Teleopsis dalmanni]